MIQLLPPRIDRHLHQDHHRHVFADELIVKIQRLRGCFLGNTLPWPSTKVIAAWNDLPNVTIDNSSLSIRTGLLLCQTPSPMEPTVDTDGTTPSALASNSGHDAGACLPVGDTTSSMSEAIPTRASACSATGEGDPMSRCSYDDQSSDQQTNEESLFRSTNSNTLPSDQESSSASGGTSPTTLVEFQNMVDQWLLDYRARGPDAFVDSLIVFGVVSVGTAIQASRIARTIVQKVSKMSDTEGKYLENTVRFSALTAFKKCWEPNNTSVDVSPIQTNTIQPTPYGINIASLMGCLFNEKMSSSRDVHLCLSLLLEGEKRHDRLCAMHALLVQANDKMCKRRNLPPLLQFRDGIMTKGRESGEYLWATTPNSKTILADILSLIERWLALQVAKREQNRITSRTGNRPIRNSAVGPRLRNGPTISFNQDGL